MVDALTFLSCCVAGRILFLWSAMTGCSPLPATLQYFLVLINLFLILTSVLLKDEHLYYIAASAVRPYWRKQGPDDCLHYRIVAMVTDPTGTSHVHLIAWRQKKKEKHKLSSKLDC